MSKKKDYILTCKQCGKQFHHTTPNKVYCSDECKQESKKKICPICGKPFIQTAPANKYCSDECYKQAKYNLEKQRIVEQSKAELTGEEGVDYVECKICGQRMTQFHVAHLEMHGITKEEYEAKYGKMIHFCSKHIEECFCGENNPNHSSNTTEQERKERSPFSKEFYKARDLSEQERLDFIKDVRGKVIPNTTLEYYRKRNYSELEAMQMLKKRQQTNTLEGYIKKYGEELGPIKFKERNEKWSKEIEERYRNGEFSKFPNNIGTAASNKEIKFFELLIKECNLSKDECEYGENEQFKIYSDKMKRNYHYDFCYKNKIIEFNGDFWHCNPKLYESDFVNPFNNFTAQEIWEKDKAKINKAKENGYDVLVVWEDDYENDLIAVINTCKEFLLS